MANHELGPRVLVFEEKYAKRYFDASTDELFNRACLAILRERISDGYWYTEPELSVRPQTKEKADIPDDVVATLPESIQKEVRQAKLAMARAQAHYDNEMVWWEALKQVESLSDEEALKTFKKDGRRKKNLENIAVWVLAQRANHEYEGWDIINLERG